MNAALAFENHKAGAGSTVMVARLPLATILRNWQPLFKSVVDKHTAAVTSWRNFMVILEAVVYGAVTKKCF